MESTCPAIGFTPNSALLALIKNHESALRKVGLVRKSRSACGRRQRRPHGSGSRQWLATKRLPNGVANAKEPFYHHSELVLDEELQRPFAAGKCF